MRKALIYYYQQPAGHLTEKTTGEYQFQYLPEYIQQFADLPITFTMPVEHTIYSSSRLFPVFEGLIPEGWLLDIALEQYGLSVIDRMGLLLTCCEDCIGAISIKSIADYE